MPTGSSTSSTLTPSARGRPCRAGTHPARSRHTPVTASLSNLDDMLRTASRARSSPCVLGPAARAPARSPGSRLAGVGATTGPARAAPLAGRRRERVDGARAAARRPRRRRGPASRALPARGRRARRRRARAGGRGDARRPTLAAVNLAAPLADGQQVVVPRRAAAAAAAAERRPPPGRRSASRRRRSSSSTSCPGIGPVTAQKIVDWRADARARSGRSTTSTTFPGSARRGSSSSASW